MDPKTLADELIAAYADKRRDVVPPSARKGGIDLDTAYEVERELVQRRRRAGYKTVGVKVGYANRAKWRALKLESVVWASMYEDTVRFATRGPTVLPISRMVSPKIEPEIVFKLKHAPTGERSDPAEVLSAVEWLALGFEIIDCVYADWEFQPADSVASYGLHAALIVGEPHHVRPEEIPDLVGQLASFTVSLLKSDQVVAEGSGKNALESPALCVGELAAAVARRSGSKPLGPGDLISSGALTGAHFLSPGQKWRAVAEGLRVSDISASIVG